MKNHLRKYFPIYFRFVSTIPLALFVALFSGIPFLSFPFTLAVELLLIIIFRSLSNSKDSFLYFYGLLRNGKFTKHDGLGLIYVYQIETKITIAYLNWFRFEELGWIKSLDADDTPLSDDRIISKLNKKLERICEEKELEMRHKLMKKDNFVKRWSGALDKKQERTNKINQIIN